MGRFYRVRIRMFIHPGLRLPLRRRFEACQITLEQNRRGNAIDHTLSLLPADIGRDQKVLGRFRRQPFVPQNDGNGHSFFQPGLELSHRLDRRPFAPIQL
jgi:hypothetical protein